MEKKKIKKKARVTIGVKNKFANAARGVFIALHEESTLLVYLFMIIICIGMGIWLKLNYIEWSVIVLTIGVVVGFEFINTSIENFVDLLSFEYSERAKKIKDICAAASILNAIAALIVGFLIYLPKLIDELSRLMG